MYKAPQDDYATIPANAQVFFTSLPLMVVWLIYSAANIVYKYRHRDIKGGEVLQVKYTLMGPSIMTIFQILKIGDMLLNTFKNALHE